MTRFPIPLKNSTAPCAALDVPKGSAGLTIKLVLTHHWYDETAAGRKRVEYRTMTDADGKPSRWYGQIWLKRHEIKRVRFARGYTPTTQVFDVLKIDIGPCHIPGWNGDFYRIHFAETNVEMRDERNGGTQL